MNQVETSVSNRVARVILNAPPLNILTSSLQDDIRAAYEELRGRKDHNVVVLESAVAGRFSAGADVGEHIGLDNCRAMLRSAHGLIAEILRCPVPTLCVVGGECLGGAFELALACDQVVATEGAAFGVPEILLGCYPPAALVLMPWKLPSMLAADLIQSGRVYTGELLIARGAGFGTNAYVDRYSVLPRGPLVEATRLLRAGAAERFLSAVGAVETAYLERLLTLHDAKEGPEAFLAKRKPDWDHSEV
ncbi:MAG: enoyl-CoA hydratase/isomerase family protein [Planctomycetes bacterium]|nr:enoyl-CoA hydratase/isomerase family protein [Planctomycetota bacterium]